MTQDKPEPETLKVHGVAVDGRHLESGERLTAYYTGRGERANWRPDMAPSVVAALGIANTRSSPRDGQLDALFEARRADNGADWSEHIRKNSGFDFVFAPHKSVLLAVEFEPTEAERQLIRNAIHAASDDALRYASQDLGVARKGHAGEKGSERGEIAWVTFAHDAARPTLAVQNGPDGATYLMDAPIAGDPHYHLHNFIPNLVVVERLFEDPSAALDIGAKVVAQGPIGRVRRGAPVRRHLRNPGIVDLHRPDVDRPIRVGADITQPSALNIQEESQHPGRDVMQLCRRLQAGFDHRFVRIGWRRED
jgi:hypothetical protein